MSDPELSHSVVEHHERNPADTYTGKDETILSGVSLAKANTEADGLRRAGRKVSVFHDDKCIDPDPSLVVLTIGVYNDPLLCGSFEGQVVEVDGGGARIRFVAATAGSQKTLHQLVDDVAPAGKGWSGKRFDLRVGLPPTIVRVYKGCAVAEPDGDGFRITYESTEDP